MLFLYMLLKCFGYSNNLQWMQSYSSGVKSSLLQGNVLSNLQPPHGIIKPRHHCMQIFCLFKQGVIDLLGYILIVNAYSKVVPFIPLVLSQPNSRLCPSQASLNLLNSLEAMCIPSPCNAQPSFDPLDSLSCNQSIFNRYFPSWTTLILHLSLLDSLPLVLEGYRLSQAIAPHSFSQVE